MNQLMKVGAACATGAFVGTLIALEGGRMFWPVGVLVGGLIGYLSYEFRTVMRSAVTAARGALWMVQMLTIGSSPERRRNRWLATSTMFLHSLTVCSVLFLGGMFLWLLFLFIKRPASGELSSMTISYLAGQLAFNLQLVLTGTTLGYVCCSFAEDLCAEDQLEHFRVVRRTTNPIYFWGVTVPRIVRTAVGAVQMWLRERITSAYLFIRHFVPRFLRLIHSEIRLLCGVDAAIGAGIGYFAGSALLGALAGGLIGVLNYELVSRLWLKLVPQRDTLRV